MKGTKRKVELGGTPFKAPLGYLNARETIGGYEARTTHPDTERAPHVVRLFAQYAIGEFSYHQLATTVTARGLTTRETTAQTHQFQQVGNILNNRYYIGNVTYSGVEYEGKHQPLISEKLFHKAQDIIASRRSSAERPSKYRHYLTGTVRC